MKIKFWLACVCLLIGIFSFGQIPQEAINKSRDYINYKLTQHCIASFVSGKVGEKYRIDYEEIKPNLALSELQGVYNYDSLSMLIAERFPLVKTKLSDKINSVDLRGLTEKTAVEVANILVDKTLGVYTNQYGKQFPIQDTAVRFSLEKDVTAYLEQSIIPDLTPGSVYDTVNGAEGLDTGRVNDNLENDPGFFSFANLNIWNLLSLFIGIGLFIFILSQLSKIHGRIDRRKKIGGDDPMQSINANHNSVNHEVRKGDVERFINNSDKISDLNEALSELQNRISKLEYGTSIPNQFMGQTQTGQTESNLEEVFYMMKPVDDYFPNSNKSSQKNDTVYKFTVKSNKTEAMFEIHTGGAPVNDIAKRNEAYIKPACEEENMPGSVVNNIITKRNGIASLEGDKWIIKTKATIRYE